jgi:hypothetical protein
MPNSKSKPEAKKAATPDAKEESKPEAEPETDAPDECMSFTRSWSARRFEPLRNWRRRSGRIGKMNRMDPRNIQHLAAQLTD